MLPCSWKETFGVECPACGAQRSFLELVSGHIWESILLFPALIPYFITIGLTIIHLFNNKLVSTKWIIIFFILSVSLMLGNWVVKMFH